MGNVEPILSGMLNLLASRFGANRVDYAAMPAADTSNNEATQQRSLAWTHYLRESRRPLASLLFVLPLLAAYEVGVLVVPHAVQNGADVWLRNLLSLLGLRAHFLLPVLTIGILLGWHYLAHERWYVAPRVLAVMLAESVLLALVLFGIASLPLPLLLAATADSAPLDLAENSRLAQVIAFCGAGLYEELLFRLLLLSLLALAFRPLFQRPRLAFIAAAIASSLLFAWAHYLGDYGEAFALHTFVFRLAAGLYFSTVYIVRGFGIAAGSHALYDVLVSTMW